MSAIAAYRTQVLALLTDAGMTYFSANDIDQALRWALAEYSNKRPLIRTYDFTVVGITRIHTLPTDFVTRHITNVQRWVSDPGELVDIDYQAELLDEQWIIQTQSEYANGEVLQILYSSVHQIDGLDDAAGTTVAEADETLLSIGAAGHAMQMRAMDRVETINMNNDVRKGYLETALVYLAAFHKSCIPEPGPKIIPLVFPSDDK